MRKLASVLFGIGVTLASTSTAHAAPRTFQGTCAITGVIAWKSYQLREYTFEGSGVCNGLFDGQPVTDAPIKVESKGDVYQYLAPVIGGGTGTITFTDQKVVFPIAHQQFGNALRIFVACRECSGALLATLENATETQPEPQPHAPRTAVRVVGATAQPLTR